MNVLILLLLIILNGLFSASEMAIVTARRARLEAMAESGDMRARSALRLAEAPSDFLSTVQIGITLIGIIIGAVSTTLSDEARVLLVQLVPSLAPSADLVSVLLIFALSTYLSLVIGELVPKQLALNYAEGLARTVAGPMSLLARLSRPLVLLLSLSTRLIMRLLGIREDRESSVNEREILSMVREGIEGGVFDEDEEALVNAVMRLDSRRISAVITPRPDVITFDINDPPEEIHARIIEHHFSTYPVCDGDLDNVLGIVRTKDLLHQMFRDGEINLRAALIQPIFIPESAPISTVIDQFRTTRVHTAFAVDEYGGIAGMIRMHDIVESIFGEFHDPMNSSGEAEIVEREDGSWLLDGQLTLDRLSAIMEEFVVPEDEEGDYETIAGFVMARLGRIPAAGDHFVWKTLRFEVMDMDDIRIDKVLMNRVASEEEA